MWSTNQIFKLIDQLNIWTWCNANLIYSGVFVQHSLKEEEKKGKIRFVLHNYPHIYIYITAKPQIELLMYVLAKHTLHGIRAILT